MPESASVRGLVPRAAALWLAVILPCTLLAQDSGALIVTVLAGDGAINDLHHFTPTPTLIEVRNQLGQPVRGVNVSFAFPATGPSGTFADGSRTSTGATDAMGRVTLARFTPNRLAGSYQIQVTATAGSRTATAFVRETNAFTVGGASSRRMGNGAKILIVVGVGAAIAAGSLLALKTGSSGGGSSSAAASTSISLGAITVGAPH